MAVLGGYMKGWDLVRYARGGKEGGCTTRRKKTWRKQQVRESVASLLAAWSEEHEELKDLDMKFFLKHVRPIIGQPPAYGIGPTT